MSYKVCRQVLVALAMTAGAVSGALGQEQQRHSGVIVSVAADAGTITVEEMGPWTGPDTAPRRQLVTLTSQTRIELVSRSDTAAGAGGWPGDFRVSALEMTGLRPGDFATVIATPAGGGLRAESIAVVRTPGERPRLSSGTRSAGQVR